VTRRSGRVTVSAVSPWLPADRAGVVVGDALLSIDGRDLGGFGPRAATFLLRGPTGSTTSVVVESSSKERRKLALERVAR
jgi:C-terminal processing protease CtpA/Prc